MSLDTIGRNQFGSPSYPSPLDRLRSGRRERAAQLGLSPQEHSQPYEANQSFPSSCKTNICYGVSTSSPVVMNTDSIKRGINNFKGNGLNSFSFSSGGSKGSFAPSASVSHQNMSLSGSWVFHNFVGGGQSRSVFAHTVHNPNKAVVTINAKTSEILVANKMACQLLGLSTEKLIGHQLSKYFAVKKDQYALTEPLLQSDGELVWMSGVVMDIVDSDGDIIPVSVWIQRLLVDDEPRCLVVMEPVERTTAVVTFQSDGSIRTCDKNFATLFGYSTSEEVLALNLTTFVPSVVLPLPNKKLSKEIHKQSLTGCTKDGATFPLSIIINQHPPDDSIVEDESMKCLYEGSIWVFANISGMVVLLPNGTILSCNTNFSQMLFGYSEEELVQKNISTIIPTFYEDIEFLNTNNVPRLSLDDDMEDYNEEFKQTDCNTKNATPVDKQIDCLIEDVIDSAQNFRMKSSDQSSSFLTQCSVPSFSPKGSSYLSGCSISSSYSNKENNPPSYSFNRGTAIDMNSDKLVIDTSDKALTESNRGLNYERNLCEKNDIVPIRSESTMGSASPQGVNKVEDVGRNKISSSENITSIGTLEKSQNTPLGSKVTTMSTPCEMTPHLNGLEETSLPSPPDIADGSFFGLGRHKDGSDLAVIYNIRRVDLDDEVLYCLWVSRDPEEEAEGGRPYQFLTLASSLNSTLEIESSVVSKNQSCLERSNVASLNASRASVEPAFGDYTSGSYSEKYTTLEQIGKGAFGCVKIAYRNTDRLLVVTKFIRKSKIYDECWIYDSVLGKRVPTEISLLMSLNHPNIVQVLDIFENSKYFQMVMEKHGSGMDLFEFIDRNPHLDEPLASYIFRQIVAALVHLHKLNIIHRDVKDENVILDQIFHAKLIDFGSATFLSPGKYYSTFCGTMEYCSPEVLVGNKYRGPELEMWALGVTLYTLIFGENPFFDVEETIAAILKPPFQVSNDLMDLISCLLHPNPNERAPLTEVEKHRWTNQPVSVEKYKFEEVVRAAPEELYPAAYYECETSRSASVVNSDSMYTSSSNPVQPSIHSSSSYLEEQDSVS
ncbi:PAS domain-containing serine/threonine-protein kinase-like isoform X2 [Tachypleus tridentatus]